MRGFMAPAESDMAYDGPTIGESMPTEPSSQAEAIKRGITKYRSVTLDPDKIATGNGKWKCGFESHLSDNEWNISH